MKQTLLIATTNPGKYQEFYSELKDLPFQLVNLEQAGLSDLPDPPEPFESLEANAVHKARFHAEKSGLLTVAEDSGFFVKALHGLPGVRSKRFASTASKRNVKILALLEGVKGKRRSAHFETSACIYNPRDKSYSVFHAAANGLVAEKSTFRSRGGMGYDDIFYFPPLGKLFAELSVEEKNNVSHRGKILHQLKLFLNDRCGVKQIVIPLALIIKEGKIFLNRRRDPISELNGKWEFPGGGVEGQETTIQCLKREVKEETGYIVRVQAMIPDIFSVRSVYYPDRGQLYFVCYICTITGGRLRLAPAESLGYGWFTPKEALQLDLLPMNKKCIQDYFAFIEGFCK